MKILITGEKGDLGNFFYNQIKKKHKVYTTNQMNKLKNLDLWIVGALRDEPHESHAHFDLVFKWMNVIRPKKTVLTHLGVQSDYQYICSICPKNVYPGYDGMVFKI